ncbi:MAG: hypothetical protein OXM58_03580 [Rhodospirillaceae bacterium]|nr:hypothetical protein [Rhodospirillaceae bacterium]MDE0617042.1 hypothetical protein [Rhodospirillaceae bacterium]
MTGDEKDTEIGRTLREYQAESDRLGCLASKLSRLFDRIENVQEAIAAKSGSVAAKAQSAAEEAGDVSIRDLLMEIAKADAAKRRLYKALQDQGVGHLIREDRETNR